MNVLQLDASTDPRWASFVSARAASVFHSPAWAEVLAEAYGFSVDAHVVTDARGEVVAGLPACRIDDPIGRRVVSLPFSDHCDPLVDTREQWGLLFDRLRAEGRPLSLLSLGDAIAAADQRIAIVKRARWHGLELDGGAEPLWARLAASTRRAIRKARREDVRVEPGGGDGFLREFLRMHVAVRKHKYHMLAQPGAFFAAIQRTFTRTGGWLPLAAYHQGRCIAATIFLAWGDTLYYRFNTSAADALPLRPNTLLLWEGIRLGAASGYRRLDLGRSDDDQPGLIRFKRQFGAEEREIRLLRYVPPDYPGEREAEMRRLLATVTSLLTAPSVPDAITAAAGTALYRYFA